MELSTLNHNAITQGSTSPTRCHQKLVLSMELEHLHPPMVYLIADRGLSVCCVLVKPKLPRYG